MPYIEKKDRQSINVRTDRDLQTPGELNFALTTLCVQYLGGDFSYQDLNDVLGALEGAKLEFYAKVARPYEELKEAENGTVYRA